MKQRNFIFGALAGLGALVGGAGLFVRQEKFGRAPSGERLKRIQASPHYVNGQFVCLEPIEVMMDDLPDEEKPNRLETLYRVLFGGDDGRVPKELIPSRKTDLHAIPREQDVAIWMGHSTFYLQVGGRRMIVDPVFSDYGSPIFFINRAFRGSNVYTAEDIPELDVLLMTHDHWDHLDYATVMALKPKVKEISVRSVSVSSLSSGDSTLHTCMRRTGIRTSHSPMIFTSTSCCRSTSRGASSHATTPSGAALPSSRRIAASTSAGTAAMGSTSRTSGGALTVLISR